MTRGGGALQFHRIAPEIGGFQSDLIVGPPNDGVTERATEMMQGLTKRPAGFFLIEIGPEEGEERVATAEAAGHPGRQVCEEGQPLGLHGNGIAVAEFAAPARSVQA